MANPADLTTPEMRSTLSFYQQSTLLSEVLPIRLSTIYNPVILTVGELQESYSLQVMQESVDRQTLSNFFAPSQSVLVDVNRL